MGGAASRGSQKGVSDAKGFQLQGHGLRKDPQTPAAAPALERPSVRLPGGTRAPPIVPAQGRSAATNGNGRGRGTAPWGEKPATPQELRTAGGVVLHKSCAVRATAHS